MSLILVCDSFEESCKSKLRTDELDDVSLNKSHGTDGLTPNFIDFSGKILDICYSKQFNNGVNNNHAARPNSI